MSAAAAAAAAADELKKTDDTETGTTGAKTESMFSHKLVYWKRSGPVARPKSKYSDQPTQILFPAGAMALGQPPNKDVASARQRDDDDAGANDSLLVFTNPEVERGRKLLCFLLFLVPLDFILITVALSRGELNTDPNADGLQLASKVTYATVIINLVLALCGVFLHDARVLALFLAVAYVECFVNFVRVHTYLMVAHFLVEIILLHTVNVYRSALVPTWFTPQR